MAYSELIKNFNKIRDYMREFYVYGFKSRDDYSRKSARSYDNERRRIESWLGDHMGFRQTPEGKNVFISIDSRTTRRNPLFKAWKTKSFTDGDITLHFILMDIFAETEDALSINEIMESIDDYLQYFSKLRVFDESSLRKKIKEYVSEGLLQEEKQGKVLYYKRTELEDYYDTDVLTFFSEIAPCGVIGSFLLDKEEDFKENFAFKHHYITGTLDSEVMFGLFKAMHDKCSITFQTFNRRTDLISDNKVVPLKVMISVQNGRQYLMAYVPEFDRISAYRLDSIVSVKSSERCDDFEKLRDSLNAMLDHIWGVSTESSFRKKMEHIEFTVHHNDSEAFIYQRLLREKRCGTVESIDQNTTRFSADVYDSRELIPWIRTFICRITEIHFSEAELEKSFWEDFEEMYKMYGLQDGEVL